MASKSLPTNELGQPAAVLGSRRPLVIEIVGPAGAGKTTLVRAMRQSCQSVREGVPISKVRHLRCLMRTLARFLPVYLLRYRHSRWFTWREIRSMVYLQAWHDALLDRPPDSEVVTVLDHGPIFRLALLLEFGPEITQSSSYKLWWDNLLAQWVARLDGVVWLDAPDGILLERIRNRGRWHTLKDKPEGDAHEFLRRYRRSYQSVLSRISASGGPQPQYMNTHEASVADIAEAVLETCTWKPHEPVGAG